MTCLLHCIRRVQVQLYPATTDVKEPSFWFWADSCFSRIRYSGDSYALTGKLSFRSLALSKRRITRGLRRPNTFGTNSLLLQALNRRRGFGLGWGGTGLGISYLPKTNGGAPVAIVRPGVNPITGTVDPLFSLVVSGLNQIRNSVFGPLPYGWQPSTFAPPIKSTPRWPPATTTTTTGTTTTTTTTTEEPLIIPRPTDPPAPTDPCNP